MAEKGKVCVTGAGGYVASWLVKLLLSKGYVVHGTIRNLGDKKYAHLKTLDKASENLKLFKADLLDYNSLCAAIEGCIGVFHVACPVPYKHMLSVALGTSMDLEEEVEKMEVEIIEPAVKGTQNVLQACLETTVKRVVFVSSDGAVLMNPNWPRDHVMDEACWSDKEYCSETKNWYCLAKTAAESKVLEYAKETKLEVVTVCPSLVIGPMLQSTTNASSLVLIKVFTDGLDKLENIFRYLVDVRDVADALLLTYENPKADGRYICSSHTIRPRDLVEKLKKMYPHYNYPKKFSEVENEQKLSSEKLQKLGWSYRPLEQTLIDSVQSYQDAGVINNATLR
ncbi:hypothetical protein GIB67_033703 [Kingdonia uniflora]|uniref:3-beta hydroxysteroid dehydrogenase/isomerase domain-containing protein n=1 Tax=Kingdonia uniflora TaxID=39325 RepID=A0A7J7P404_9MAGN|nr:hypothetical protein GIB67_033703 [Kingdonia uniflora]